MVRCGICAGSSRSFAETLVLKRYPCALLPGAKPVASSRRKNRSGLEEAYREAITAEDVGLVRRNLRIAAVSRLLLKLFFDPKGKCIDYGGGYGLFTRLMRDAGYDFRRIDPHCENIFARGFEATTADAPFELLTAFEVFEHLTDPLAGVADMLRYSDSIFFTTELSAAAGTPAECPYYGPEHGQHVSFFTIRSLRILAGKHGLKLYSDGKFRHMLTPRRLPRALYAVASTHLVAAMLSPLTRRPSLVETDAAMIIADDTPPMKRKP